MKRLSLVFMIILMIPIILSAQAISVFNANSVADIIEKKSASYKSFKANFVYQKDKKSFNGVMTYVSPNKFVMEFKKSSTGDNKKIVSDGSFIWIQEGSIIARQKLGKETTVTSWNIRRLRKQYVVTAPKSGLEIVYGQTPAYQVNFEPKWNTTSFRGIELIADKTGLIQRIKGTSRVGITTTLSLTYIEFNKSYDQKIFVIETSEDSQIYDNIFE
ncbi:MAG: LolA family protein [Brevinema sp.]